MFKEIFLFEIKYRLKRPATYIYFGLLFLMTFLLVTALGGGFGSSVMVTTGAGKTLVNSPFQILTVLLPLSYFGVLIISAMMGNPVFRDFEHKTHSLYYTTPISKLGYLGGRFLGSFVVTLLVFSAMMLAFWLATLMPWVQADKFGPNNLMFYLQPYLLFIIPNMLLMGAIFFTMATLTRNVLSIYIGSVAFLVLYGVAKGMLKDLDNDFLSNILDPFGSSTMSLITKYWTVADRNTLLLPLTGMLLLNRALWLAVGALLFFFCYKRFSFSFFATDKSARPAKAAEATGVATQTQKLVLPKVRQQFSYGLSISQYLKLTKLEFKGILKSVYFIAIVAAGVILLFSTSIQIGKIYDTNTYPVTSVVADTLASSFYLFCLIIITFYAGEVVWRERDTRMNQIYDALPIPNWVPFTAKLSALMLVQVVLMALVMVCGVVLQTAKGYFRYELDVYVKELFVFQLADLWLLCVLAMLVQVVVNNKYLGHFVMVLYYVSLIFMGIMGFDHLLYTFASDIGTPYSAMNGYGHYVQPFFIFKLYWGAFALLLAVLSNLLWVRGTETFIKWRLKLARLQLSRSSLLVSGLALAVFLVSGGFIFYNTNILNEYKTTDQVRKEMAEFEKKYKKYENIAQPRVVEANIHADIYPKEREFGFSGYLWLKNKTEKTIDSVHVNLVSTADIRKLGFSRKAKQVMADKDGGYYIYHLAQPLQPGDSLKLNFHLFYPNKGFSNNGSNNSIVYNGSFLNSQYIPSIGYSENSELSDDDIRKEHGLQPKPRMAAVDDLHARRNTYIANDSDWIRFQATVSTSKDQVAIAPGYLQKEWTKGDRRYFHYKMDAPILNFYSFLSADYKVKKDKWVSPEGKPVNIEIYYHEGHEYNLDRMIKGVKKSLDYYTSNFSPYQHRQVRIIEFPGYSSFAQSFPNTIPFSESIGFIADVDDKNPEDVDYPFYVTAHEVAHQWWAHQVIGGDVQGSTLLSETMSQYSALMVMKQEYGADRMKKFLKYEMDKYLSNRSFERKKELPLYLVENQQYIHYQKGSVVMYALADYLGEENLNRALKQYVQKVAFQQAPFTNTIEFLRYIKAATPDSLQYLVTDMFEKITLYENKVNEVSYKKLPDGKYKVTLTVDAKKYYADSLGAETEAPMKDYVDIGVLARKKIDGQWQDVPLYMQKHLVKPGSNKFELIVSEKPAKAGIDPLNKLIDRTPSDNVKDIKETKAG